METESPRRTLAPWKPNESALPDPLGGLGGAERALLDLVASLKRVVPELAIEVLALEDGPLLSEAAALGAITDTLPLPDSLARLGESGSLNDSERGFLSARTLAALAAWLPRFSRLLDSKRVDIIHSNGLKTHFLAALAKPRSVPLVLHLHDFLSERPLSSRILPLLRRRISLAVAVSVAVERDAQKTLRTLKTAMILNGVRTELFSPGTVAPMNLDASAGFCPALPGTLRIGLVATYALWKGHHLFLEAAAQLRDLRLRF